MSAIIRVKRRCDEDPIDALILNCKRRKTDFQPEESSTSAEESLSTLLKFAGTLENQEDDIFKHIKKPSKVEIEESFKKHYSTIRDKLRDQVQESSKNNRYKIVNLCRSSSVPDDSNVTEDKKAGVTIVDLETCVEDKASTTDYVYDLYYTNSDDLGEIYEQDLIGIYPLSQPLVYGSQRDNGVSDSDNESEDSNAENNWRNDYPDEEDQNSITEDDMISAMNKVKLDDDEDGENELSSDDEGNGFVYSIDSEGAGFEEDIDDSDVNRYGEQYARFKAKYKKNLSDSSFNEDYYEDDEYNEVDATEWYMVNDEDVKN